MFDLTPTSNFVCYRIGRDNTLLKVDVEIESQRCSVDSVNATFVFQYRTGGSHKPLIGKYIGVIRIITLAKDSQRQTLDCTRLLCPRVGDLNRPDTCRVLTPELHA